MNQRFHSLNEWLKSHKGERVAVLIAEALAPLIKSYRGERLLQLGIEEHQNWLAVSRIPKKLVLLPFTDNTQCSLVSSLYEMPIDEASIDVIFCPFNMELLHHDMSFLSEIDRILVPGGYVIFCGVNPFSFWGLPRLWQQASQFPCWQSGLYGARKLSSALLRFGYATESITRFGYWPPCVKRDFYMRFYQQLGKMLLPFPSGFYLLSAQKQVFSVIHPQWTKPPYIKSLGNAPV